MTGVRRRFPSLKDTLVVRMAQPAGAPNLAPDSIVPPKLPTEAAPIALPTIVEGIRLKAQRPRTTDDRDVTADAGWRRPFGASLIAALVATFIAGNLFAYALYATNLMPGMAKPTLVAQPQDPVWPDLLAPGAISPRGQSSAGVSADQAFQIADAKLHGLGLPPDHDEARYWLRVGIAGALSGDRLRWALTQLGTLYARPAASPADFAVARSVWELASAQKDPVALCFLARLEDSKPVSQRNNAIALKLFEQAKAAGTCSGSDQAIERLSR